jgi:hypothetical protein
MVDDFKPGIYAHYKNTPESPRYYQVLGVARNTETDELYALYIPLYVIPEHTGVRWQVRPLDMFLEKVEWQGETVDRFRYIGQQLH